MKQRKLKQNSGFSLVETLIYIFLITVLTVSVINALVFMTKSYREIRAEKSIILSANTLLNRFSYEVKRSDDLSGTFGVSTSSLTLISGATSTIISLDSTVKRVLISINGVTDYLTSAEVEVTTLEFNKLLATSTSKGAVLQFSITSKTSTPKTESFETTALIRNLNI